MKPTVNRLRPVSYTHLVADFNQALKVAQKKDDVYYNIGKLMYAYQLSKPEKTYKDWTYAVSYTHLPVAERK